MSVTSQSNLVNRLVVAIREEVASPRRILLAAERAQLIEVSTEVGRRNRRMATLVRLHRQVTRELIQVVLGPEDGGDVHAGGSLIDAEV